jgi:hypothetical protein
MNDRIVTLYRIYYTEEAWFNLSVDFGFNKENDIAYIHVINDEN